jgi:hypothetical protein
MEYAGSHACSGGTQFVIPEEMTPPPEGICPGYYLRLAFNIARWDEIAIRRASRDPDALFYGAIFSAISVTIIFLVTALPKMLSRRGASEETIFFGLLLGLVFVWLYMSVIAIIQIGLCHLIARWFLGATGTLFGVARPLLLGWFVNCLILIPLAGPLAAAIAWTAILMLVFEEVDGIARMQAFLISAGINAIFLALELVIPR